MNKYQSLTDLELASLCNQYGITHLNVDIIVRNVEVALQYEFDSIKLFNGDYCMETFALTEKIQAKNRFLSCLTETQKIALELDCRCYNESVQHDRKAY